MTQAKRSDETPFRFLTAKEVTSLKPSAKKSYHEAMALQDTGRVYFGKGGVGYTIVRTQYDPIQNEVFDTYLKERELPNKRGEYVVVHTFVVAICNDDAIREKYRTNTTAQAVDVNVDVETE